MSNLSISELREMLETNRRHIHQIERVEVFLAQYMRGYKFYYETILDEEAVLLPREKILVEQMLKICRYELNVPDLYMVWLRKTLKPRNFIFIKEYDEPTYGWADAEDEDLICVRCDIPFEQILKTIAHEAYHQWYRKKYGKNSYTSNEENAAEAFAEKAMSLLKRKQELEIICAIGPSLSIWNL